MNAQEYGKLAHLETNLNTLAKHLNAGNIVAGEAAGRWLRTLEDTKAELQQLRAELLGARPSGAS